MDWIRRKVDSWKPERNTVYIRCKTSLEEIIGMERNGEIYVTCKNVLTRLG